MYVYCQLRSKSSLYKQFKLPHRLYSMFLNGYDNSFVDIRFSDGRQAKFNKYFLRDSCSSESSVDRHSGQKLFNTAHIIEGLEIKNAQISQRGSNTYLNITWEQRGRKLKSEYEESFLWKYSSPAEVRKPVNYYDDKIFWKRKDLMFNLDDLWISYDAYLNDKTTWNKCLDNLNKFGICFIRDIPDPVEAGNAQIMNEENVGTWPVAKMASKFGYIKKTFYGSLFDVKNEKEAVNIANTDTFLPLHMDLLYYESPPGLQYLHFIKNSTIGGENIFADSYTAIQHVRSTDIRAYNALKNVPIVFQFMRNGEAYYYKRPLVVEDDFIDEKTGFHAIKHVNYSPPFQGPFEDAIMSNSGSLFEDFLRGYKLFTDFVNQEENQYQQKMKEGTAVIFDNRRVLHSRLSFSSKKGGERWLMGCYVDGDSFRSRLRISKREF